MNLNDCIKGLVARPSSRRLPSVTIVRQRREGVDLEQRDASRTFRFSGELTGPRWNQINIRVRNEGWDKQLLDSVAEALRQGGYEFMIYSLGDEQPFLR